LKGHHFRFTPRLEEGAWLAARKEVRAMMDLSDGLAKDLHSLVPNGARPAIVAARVPISPAAKQLSRQTNRPPLEHAASDGEDYELLFVVAKDADRAAFERAWKKRFPLLLTCIGRFVKRGELATDTVDLSAYHGYEHLR
jgi:thiamine-monophosphate kinase